MTPPPDERPEDTGPWEVLVDAPFQRGLDRLPPRIAIAIAEYVTAVLPQDPVRMSKPLGGDLAGLRSARRGDYRVLFEVDVETRTIWLVRVDHRAHVYRGR